MSFRDKKARYLCYASRDKYWACLDTVPVVPHNSTSYTRRSDASLSTIVRRPAPSAADGVGGGAVNHAVKYGGSGHLQVYGSADQQQEPGAKPCMELRRLCQLSCPEHWMKHFDRKRQYMLFREKVAAVGNMSSETATSTIEGETLHQEQLRHKRQDSIAPATSLQQNFGHRASTCAGTTLSSNDFDGTFSTESNSSQTNGVIMQNFPLSRIPTINLPIDSIALDSDRPVHINSKVSETVDPINIFQTVQNRRDTSPESPSPSSDLNIPSLSCISSALGLHKLFTVSTNDLTPARVTPSQLDDDRFKRRSLSERMLLSLQVPPLYTPSPSPSPSPTPSPTPLVEHGGSNTDPASATSPPVRAPPRRRRVYSQIVFGQRLVPTS